MSKPHPDMQQVRKNCAAWIAQAQGIDAMSKHLPLTGTMTVQPAAERVLAGLRDLDRSGDLQLLTLRDGPTGARLTRATEQWVNQRVREFHDNFWAGGYASWLGTYREYVLTVRRAQFDELSRLLEQATELRDGVGPVIDLDDRLPLSSPVLSAEARTTLTSLAPLIDLHVERARCLFQQEFCGVHDCAPAHESADRLVDIVDPSGPVAGSIRRAQQDVGAALEADRRHLRTFVPVYIQRQEILRGWQEEARRALHRAQHMPLTSPEFGIGPGAALADQILAFAPSDADKALLQAALDPQAEPTPVNMALAAAERVADFQIRITQHPALSEFLEMTERLGHQVAREAARLQAARDELAKLGPSASRVLTAHAHPLLREADLLSPNAVKHLKALTDVAAYHLDPAGGILSGEACAAGQCADAHRSAQIIAAYADVADHAGLWARLRDLIDGAVEHHAREKAEVTKLSRDVAGWASRVASLRDRRRITESSVRMETQRLRDASRSASVRGHPVDLIGIGLAEERSLANAQWLSEVWSSENRRRVEDADALAAEFSALVPAGLNADGDCAQGRLCESIHHALPELARKVRAFNDFLESLDPSTIPRDRPSDDELVQLLQNSPLSGTPHGVIEILQGPLLAAARRLIPAVLDHEHAVEVAQGSARQAAESVRQADVRNTLSAMDLEVLRKASDISLRTAPLVRAGVTSVQDVLDRIDSGDLARLPGLSSSTAGDVARAALRLHEVVREETPVRIDIRSRSSETTELLHALRTWDALRRWSPDPDEVDLAAALHAVLTSTSAERVAAIHRGVQSPQDVAVRQAIGELLDAVEGRLPAVEVWQDFAGRPADFFGALNELGFVTEDQKKMHGDLPEEIVEAIRRVELNRTHLRANLRAYQGFGARFAIAQERVIIGDEMGLGKTVEALAVMAHLRGRGENHFLVVCPAAVVSNWVREVRKHTGLPAYRFHGSALERSYQLRSWRRGGGIAVTTFGLLPWLEPLIAEDSVAAVVVDEAHYIKNPLAQRARSASLLLDRTPFAILMTGTPLENSVQEFRNLVGYLRPDLAESAPDYYAAAFRKHVAPAYLRRNAEDVLTELPELVEVDEWLEFTAGECAAYAEAVGAGDFMGMRRIGMLEPESTKLSRLKEIVLEAEENGRRVVVFSYFLEVTRRVADALPGRVFGPLTGATPAIDRQRMVDDFSEASGGAVLVSQIGAGGVGLNIQAASVVILCEPQVKPTLESQAIARAHRMGQVHSVQVHRLMTEGAVDERIRDILEEKRRLFDEFARESVIAERAPEALDIGDTELARLVVAAERERLSAEVEVGAVSPSESGQEPE